MELEPFIKYLETTDFDNICIRFYDAEANKTADVGLCDIREGMLKKNSRFKLVAIYFVDTAIWGT